MSEALERCDICGFVYDLGTAPEVGARIVENAALLPSQVSKGPLIKKGDNILIGKPA